VACDYKDDDDAPNLMTVVDRDGAKAAELVHRFKFARWRVQSAIVLEDQEVHLAVISERDTDRLMHAAANAGKRLHLECHPFDKAIDAELIGIVERANVMVNVSYRHFTNPSIVLLREMVASGELGTVIQIRARLTAGEGLSCVEGLSEQSAPSENSIKSAFLAVLAIARKVLGEIGAVSFRCGSQRANPRHVALRFESGANGTIEMCDAFLGAGPSFQIEIQGTRGAIAFNTYEPGFLRFQKRNGSVGIGEPGTVFPASSHFPSNVHWEFRNPHFSSIELKAIELATLLGAKSASDPSFANLRDALRIQALINAALADARSHPFAV